MDRKVQKTIVDKTCSQSLIAKIKEINFIFDDFSLLLLAYKHAKDFGARLYLLGLIATNTNDSQIKKQAKKCIEFENKKLSAFQQDVPNCIFEIKIKETPTKLAESLLGSSYQNALDKVKWFCRRWKVKLNDSSRIEIIKRTLDDLPLTGYRGDWQGDADFRANMILTDVSHIKYYNFKLNKTWVVSTAPKLPKFLNDMDIVCYDNHGEREYGIYKEMKTTFYSSDGDDDLEEIEKEDDKAYILRPFSNLLSLEINSEKEFWEVFDTHTHIQYPLLEVVSPENLSNEMQETYTKILELFKMYGDEQYYKQATVQIGDI